MAAADVIKLRAKARKLSIDGYKAMSVPELEKAIKRADNGAAPKTPAKTAKKTATKTAARKTASVKSAPAAKSTKGKAKRPTTGATRKTAKATPKAEQPKRRGRPPGSKNRPKTQAAPKVTKAQADHEPGRILIDNASIDWKAETRVGQTPGNRQVILKHLRKFKGNVSKVFEALKDEAQQMYPKTSDGKRRSKAEAQTLLRWHISRVKFDFVKDTGQHEGVVRSKAAGGRKSAAKPKAGTKSTRKPAGRQKAAQSRAGASAPKRRGRPPGSKNKPKAAAAKTGTARKGTASRKRR